MPSSLEQGINEFTTRFVAGYYAPAGKPKFVHDSIWGTIPIEKHELAIINTPLLQRLRQIHQTGFVYQTFPSAHHTRFEHTIGVMHIAGRIAETLQSKYQRDFRKTRIVVRLAALLHDTGHGAFSHTTEEIYKLCPDIAELLTAGGKFEGKGAGELLSYLITTSAAFRTFFDLLKKDCAELHDVSVDDFAPLILARPANPQKQFEAEIISGPFDADKIDYFPRDGRAAGLSIALDLERLLHCLELVETKKNGNTTEALVVSRGGFNPIQQLLFARATLSATVYHHQKVRACDCMVKGAFEYYRANDLLFKKNGSFAGVKLQSAADFLHITDDDFFSEAYNHPQETYQHDIIHRLLYRRLIKRVITISKHTIVDGNDPEALAGYDTFYNLRSNPAETRRLTKELYSAAGLGDIPLHEVWIDIPHSPALNKAGTAQINLAPRGKPPQLSLLGKIIPVDDWVKTYDQYYAQSHVFGPVDPSVRIKLGHAAKDFFAEKYQLKLKPDAFAEDIREQFS